MATVTIPNQWQPRDYQLEALSAFDNGIRRQYHIWHRRAGKDSFCLNLAAIKAHEEVGTYWHLLPKQTQARKAIWHGIGKDGTRFIDQAYPKAIRKRTSNQEMLIEFKNGSTWQLNGSDTYDTLVGSNVKGVVFSEWALCDPRAWDYIRPIILENNGWAIFITTYRGKNHAYTMLHKLKDNKDWLVTVKTIDDTGVLSQADMDSERAEGMDEATLQQEYYCSPMAAFSGAFYIKEMMDMQAEKRVAPIAYDPILPVYGSMDLGMDDWTTVVFWQELYNEPRIIGSRAYRMTSIPDICADLRKLPWSNNMELILPHDGAVTEMGTGVSRQQSFELAGFKSVLAKRDRNKLNGIELTRQLLKRTYIDNASRSWSDGEENNFILIEALQGYRTEEKAKQPGVFNLSPAHTWESHYADAVRTYASYRSQHGGTATVNSRWNKVPDYGAYDRGVI